MTKQIPEIGEKNENVPTKLRHTCDEAVELTGHGYYNYLVLLACCMITVGVALDMFGFSVVVTAAACDLNLDIYKTGVLASASFAAVLFAFPWGYYADTRGRRRAMLWSTTVGAAFAAATSLAPSWQVMFVLKLFGCIFSIPSFNLTMTYLGECTDYKHRSRYLFIMNSANLASDSMYYSLAYLLLSLNFRVPIPWLSITYRPWRLYTLVMAIPLGLGTLLLLPLHESAKFLASRGRTDEALEVLRSMYKGNGGVKENYPVKSLFDESVASADVSFWGSLVEQTVPVFKPPLLWRTLQLFFLMALCCSTNNVFLMWYPLMVNQFFNSFSGAPGTDSSFCDRVVTNITKPVDADNYICDDKISPNTIYSGMILGLIFAFLSLVASFLAGWRKLMLIGIYLISAVCLLLVNFIRNPIANMIVFTLVQITAVGIGSVASYFVDLYPTNYRALVTGLAVMVSRLVTSGALNLMGVIIVHYCSATFIGWALFVCFGIVVAYFLPSDKVKPSQ